MDQAVDHARHGRAPRLARPEVVAVRARLEAVARVERAGGERRPGRAHVHGAVRKSVVFGVRRFQDAIRERLEEFPALRERKLFPQLRRQLVRPRGDDLRPVERAVRALPVHHHGDIRVVDAVVVLRHLRRRHVGGGGVVVRERQQAEAAVQVAVQHLLAHAVPVRGGVHLHHVVPVHVRIRLAVARRDGSGGRAGARPSRVRTRRSASLPRGGGGGRRDCQTDEVSAFHAAIIPFSAAGWQ